MRKKVPRACPAAKLGRMSVDLPRRFELIAGHGLTTEKLKPG